MNLSHVQRRDWMRRVCIGFGAAQAGWLPRLAAAIPSRDQTPRSVIVLWMSGGPATIDMWDMKPGHENGGPFREIATSVPGIRISEHLPELARWTQRMAIVRSLTSSEGDHRRGTYFVRTGYKPFGAIRFPAFGSVATHALPRASDTLPPFVSIAPTRRFGALTGGFLGPNYSPLAIESTPSGDLTVANLPTAEGITAQRELTRLTRLRQFDADFAAQHEGDTVVEGLIAATKRATQLMSPSAAQAFELEQEPANVREAYGQTAFGQGCLLARRLVERNVRFVEVSLDGWDTHSDNFKQVAGLSAVLDRGFSSLLAELQDRGLLDSTLVLCLGEFGRTPVINGSVGRDHYPAAWSAVLAGGSIAGAQTFGATTPDGTEVAEQAVTPPDLLATLCAWLGIDPRQQNMSNVGRPIRVVDPDANPIKELLP